MTNQSNEPIFNLIDDVYDNLFYIRTVAERLVKYAEINSGQRVLDVACGTGWATMASAWAVGNTGRVIGIDIADRMLNVAKNKAVTAGLSNIEYRVADAAVLGFDDSSFNTVICSSSLFLLRDQLKALSEWRRVLKTGGTIAFSSWGASLLQPLGELFRACLSRYDEQAPPDERLGKRTDTPEKCRELLNRADFQEIDCTAEQLGSYIQDTEVYWQQMTSSYVKPRLNRLNPEMFERFKKEHLTEVESLRTDHGIWMDVPVVFSVARKLS